MNSIGFKVLCQVEEKIVRESLSFFESLVIESK